MVVRRLIFALFSMLICGTVLPAQEGSDVRRLVVFVEVEEGGAFSTADTALLEESLLLSLTRELEALHILAGGTFSGVLDQRVRSNITIGRDADAWLAVVLSGGMEALKFEVFGYDLVSRKRTISQSTALEVPTTYRDLDRRLWAPVVDEVRRSFAGIEFGTNVTVSGRPGTEVSGLTDEPLVLGRAGEVTVRLPNPSAYALRATLSGYEPVREEFVLDDEPLEIILEQETVPPFFIDAFLHTLNFPGAAFGWQVVPGTAFVRLGFTTFVAGIYLPESEGAPLPLILSLPFTQLELDAAFFIVPSDSVIRPYAGAGAVSRVLHNAEFFGLDPLAPIGFRLIAGARASLFGSLLVTGEFTPLLLLTPDVGLLGGSYPGNYDAFHAVRIGGLSVDFLNFRVGVRFLL